MMIYFNLISLFKGLPLRADAPLRLQLPGAHLQLQLPASQFFLVGLPLKRFLQLVSVPLQRFHQSIP